MKTLLIGLLALLTLDVGGAAAQARGRHGGGSERGGFARGGFEGGFRGGGEGYGPPGGYERGGGYGPRAFAGPRAFGPRAFPGPRTFAGPRAFAGGRGPYGPGPMEGGYRGFARGQFLPPAYWGGAVVDPRQYHLRRPPNGYGWVTVGPNAYLTQRSTGLILDTAPLY